MTGFEVMLAGGHPNSLGRTEEVVDLVLADHERLDELYRCWFSEDEIVRLRTASAMKRVTIARPNWVLPYVDRLQGEIAAIDQPSTQWTLALLFDLLRDRLTRSQHERAAEIMRTNLEQHDDWIVLGNSMKVLGAWSASDPTMAAWLRPLAERHAGDPRKSVAGNARKLLTRLDHV